MLDYFMEQFKVLQYEHLAILWGTNIVSGEQARTKVCYYINPNLSIWVLNLLSAVAKETTATLHLIIDLIRLEKREYTLGKKSIQIQIRKLDIYAFLKALYRVVLLEETAKCTVVPCSCSESLYRRILCVKNVKNIVGVQINLCHYLREGILL